MGTQQLHSQGCPVCRAAHERQRARAHTLYRWRSRDFEALLVILCVIVFLATVEGVASLIR